MDQKTIIKKLAVFKYKLNKKINVQEVILFGSIAKGTAKKDSDIDLIIVSKSFKGTKFRYRPLEIYDSWNINYPVDFICYTPEEFNKLKKQVTIVREAVREGIEI